MKKTFCDSCGKEMTEVTNGKSFSVDSGNVSVTVNASIGLPDPSDLCKYCVIDAVNKADDRPKVSAE